MGLLTVFDYTIITIGLFGFFYQVFCIVIGLFAKPYEFPEVPDKTYCVIISARNESAVIGNLLDSIKNQNYSHDKLDVWVVADNCTDNTAQICRDKGAYVVERQNQELIGKGYALSYLFDNMRKVKRHEEYEAFIVLDADNILDRNYVSEMNKVFSAGYKVVTSYRNSKNFASNWVSSGSALWFVKESRLLNNSRMIFGASCHVGGTGFMFSKDIMERNNGWKHHLLTEDLEFTMDCVLHENKVGYAGKAMLYDEQPVTFAQSWRQRLRWSKGFLQVFSQYGEKLIRNAFSTGNFSCLDLTLLMFPWVFLQVVRIIIGAFYVIFGFVSLSSQLNSLYQIFLAMAIGGLLLMIIAGITVIGESKQIGASKKELVTFVFSFPLYVLSYVPISFVAIFSKVEWKPIVHGINEVDKIIKQDASKK